MTFIRIHILKEFPRQDPLRVLRALPRDARPAFLDSSDGHGSSWLGWKPDMEIKGDLRPSRMRESAKGCFASHDPAMHLEEASRGEVWDEESMEVGIVGGWVGWFGFECAHAWEPWPWAKRNSERFPDYSFRRYRRSLQWAKDGTMRLIWCEIEGSSIDERAEVLEECERWLALAKNSHDLPSNPSIKVATQFQPLISKSEYEDRVALLQNWIGEGELFQANISHPLKSPAPSGPREFYGSVRKRQPTEMSSYLELGYDKVLMSWSPERFLSVDGSRLATFPIKGTAPRGYGDLEDKKNQFELSRSVKEKAELAMIVDMARHDLGRLASLGSVVVQSPGEVLSLSTLHHRVAAVHANWNPDEGLSALMRATFPPASVTGAPKIRALQAIVELEGEARGPYCGCFGYWLPGKPRGDFSVLIRTAILSNQQIVARVGAGIVWDSQPESEWEETLLKAQYLI